MPIFEYECPECGRIFERLVPKADTQVRCHCPNTPIVRKKLAAFAVGVKSTPLPGCGGCAPGASKCPSACPGAGMCGL